MSENETKRMKIFALQLHSRMKRWRNCIHLYQMEFSVPDYSSDEIGIKASQYYGCKLRGKKETHYESCELEYCRFKREITELSQILLNNTLKLESKIKTLKEVKK